MTKMNILVNFLYLYLFIFIAKANSLNRLITSLEVHANIRTSNYSSAEKYPENATKKITKLQRRNDRVATGKIIFEDELNETINQSDKTEFNTNNINGDKLTRIGRNRRTRLRNKQGKQRQRLNPSSQGRNNRRKPVGSIESLQISTPENVNKRNLFGVFDSVPLSDLDANFESKRSDLTSSPSRVNLPGPPYIEPPIIFNENDAVSGFPGSNFKKRKTNRHQSPEGFQNYQLEPHQSRPYDSTDPLKNRKLSSSPNVSPYDNNKDDSVSSKSPIEKRGFGPDIGEAYTVEVVGSHPYNGGLAAKDYPEYGYGLHPDYRYPNYGHANLLSLESPSGPIHSPKYGNKALTVTHTQYKKVPVTRYVTDTRTDYITHYKTHYQTKVHKIPVTEYSTVILPKEVPVYKTIYNTVYQTLYKTITTNRHHTIHYTATKHRTTVLTNYITTTSHLIKTSVLHTTLYEPVYLTTTLYDSVYITTTQTKNYHHTSTTYTPVYLTTTSLQKVYETETVITPHYITTTRYQEVLSTVTQHLYVTTTEKIHSKVPVYLTTTHTAKLYLTTTSDVPYYLTTTVLAPSPPQYYTTTITKAAAVGGGYHLPGAYPHARGAV